MPGEGGVWGGRKAVQLWMFQLSLDKHHLMLSSLLLALQAPISIPSFHTYVWKWQYASNLEQIFFLLLMKNAISWITSKRLLTLYGNITNIV